MLDGQHAQTSTPPPNQRYATEVLALPDGETEDALDEAVTNEAKELGLDVEVHGLGRDDKRLSSKTLSSDAPRRSESISSKASQSTGFTSVFSDLSRGRRTSAAGIPNSRPSLSSRDYDPSVPRGRPNGRQSVTSSRPITPSPSVFSLPLSSPDASPRRHFRRLRGLNMLRLHKNDSSVSLFDSCPHCPQNASSQRRAVHQLPCGHRLCTQALRVTIKKATESDAGAVPSCCGQPIPANLVETVTNPNEQVAPLKLDQWDRRMSMPAALGSPLSSRRPSGVPVTMSRTTSDCSRMSNVDSPASKPVNHQESPPDIPELNILRQQQTEQRSRFQAWIDKSRAEHKAELLGLREEMRPRHEKALEQLQEHQAEEMLVAEDRQVKAEADLRVAHTQEKLSNATALKHMEAYCAGTYSTGEPHNRTVTDQDRAELDKARRARDQMDAKHASSINVLRSEQSRRMKARGLRQEKELQDLRRRQRYEELELERDFNARLRHINEDAEERRERLQLRWELQTRIVLKKHEDETGVLFTGSIPVLLWDSDIHRPSDASYQTARPVTCIATDKGELAPELMKHDFTNTSNENMTLAVR